ncbi:MAG: hypothetical protein EA417_15400 [Gammaproteobacteria bacterium]|nr:MAG: hypothetical protein EA417_15400 [Gammaproteobacteria bacterium]
MFELLAWVEGTALASFLRGAGVWTYGLINLAHILGIGSLFGAILILDLRLLGAWRTIPLAVIARPTVPLAAGGFLLAVSSGLLMISFNATEYYGNPFLYIKLPAIVFGLLNVVAVQQLPAWRAALAGFETDPVDRRLLAVAGGVSLTIWLTVITCGRMIGYW